MLRRLWRRTEVGRKQDTFSFTSHKMLFGLFGIDPAGNVICLLQHRANQTAGSWGVVVHDSVSWPLHWFAMQQRHKLRIEDVRNDARLCKSVFVRRFYKTLRLIYKIILLYFWFLGYWVVKQNALNQDARIVLTDLEQRTKDRINKNFNLYLLIFVVLIIRHEIRSVSGGDVDDATIVANQKEDTELVQKISTKVTTVVGGIRDVAFAMAEDLHCYDNNQYLDDSYELVQRRIEALKRLKKSKKQKQAESSELVSSNVWKAIALVASVAAFVLI
jgi:hypothetical protein